MNLQESIRRILNEELPSKINESFTGETPTEIEQQFINKPVKLIGDVNTNTIIKKLNVNKDGSVNITFQNGMKVNSSIPMLRRFDIGVDIPLKFNVRKKTIVNESDESRQERKFTKLLNNIEEYINSNSYNSVIRVMVDYDEVMDDVIVNIFFDAEHAVKLGGGINSVIKRSGKKIMEDLSVFPFDFKYHIHFEKPQLNESRTNSSLNNLLNMLFDGFDDIYYDWANYMCGMGECCDPYAIGFTLPKNHYDDYIFKLVDSVNYDDDGDYSKELRDELPEVCYESPDLKNPDFDTIVFYGLYAEEIEDYMGPESNWRSDLLKLINKKFGCEAKQIIII
jgi:hypothetical protein